MRPINENLLWPKVFFEEALADRHIEHPGSIQGLKLRILCTHFGRYRTQEGTLMCLFQV